MQTLTIRGENITVDLLLHRLYGVRGRSLVEKTYDLNPGLAMLGPVLPLGTQVLIPDLPPQKPFSDRMVITLFG